MEAPQFDRGQTEGMCGNFDGNADNVTILILAEMGGLMQTKPRSGKAGELIHPKVCSTQYLPALTLHVKTLSWN